MALESFKTTNDANIAAIEFLKLSAEGVPQEMALKVLTFADGFNDSFLNARFTPVPAGGGTVTETIYLSMDSTGGASRVAGVYYNLPIDITKNGIYKAKMQISQNSSTGAGQYIFALHQGVPAAATIATLQSKMIAAFMFNNAPIELTCQYFGYTGTIMVYSVPDSIWKAYATGLSIGYSVGTYYWLYIEIFGERLRLRVNNATDDSTLLLTKWVPLDTLRNIGGSYYLMFGDFSNNSVDVRVYMSDCSFYDGFSAAAPQAGEAWTTCDPGTIDFAKLTIPYNLNTGDGGSIEAQFAIWGQDVGGGVSALNGTWLSYVNLKTQGTFAVPDREATKAVTSITRSGSTATVHLPGHGYNTGDSVLIAGADQTEYNKRTTNTVTRIDADYFSYAVSGTPASPATGTITAQRANSLKILVRLVGDGTQRVSCATRGLVEVIPAVSGGGESSGNLQDYKNRKRRFGL